ncbi:TPM domain-containing protein [Glycomyces endophyticus]
MNRTGSTARRAAAALTAAVFAAVLLQPAAAEAVAPITLSGTVTDQVDALGDRAGEVQEAIDDLRSSTGIGLYVAYIESFDSYSPQTWADTSAVDSGLGSQDLLLAIATGDRRYTWSVDADFPLTDTQLNEVASSLIAPQLQSGDWAQAAVDAAAGYEAAYEGGDVAGAGSGSGVNVVGVVLCLLAVAAVVVGAVIWMRRRRKRPAAAGGAGAPPVAQRSTEDLNSEANRLLVETDDALRTSEQELGFAVAEFGDEATGTFSATLQAAKEQLSQSFRTRQLLDDDRPETEDERRRMLADIIDRLTKANDDLDAVADDFDALRDLGKRAPEAIAALKERAAGIDLYAARAALAAMGAAYPASAVETVRDFPDTAADRLRFAHDQLAEADQAVAADDGSKAAVLLRAAEEAVGQAEQMAAAVVRRGGELDEAAAQLPGVLAEAEQDAADAERLATAQGGQAVAAKAANLRAAIADVKAASGQDPLAATGRVEQASLDLEQEVRALQGAVQHAQKAQAQLQQMLLSAQSTAAAVEDYVTTNRGAVGPEARTRLNEANQQLAQARALAATDPVQALALAQRADQLANAASQLAQQDVQGYLAPSNPNKGGGGGGNAGAMLGGILLGQILGGGGNRGPGGFGGGGFGGGGGRRGPGSFGGSGTRGRRGGGGRF